MVRQLTTRAQVSGYRFPVATRRAPRASRCPDAARSDARAAPVGHDRPRRSDPRCRGVRVYGLIRPVGSVADAPIVLQPFRGGLYVVVEGHRAPAQPRLGTPGRRVGGRAEDGGGRGCAIAAWADAGIVGAPNALGSGAAPAWTVCDAVNADGDAPSRTVVVIGDGLSHWSGRRCRRRVVRRRRRTGLPRLPARAGSAARTVRAPFDADAEPVRRALGLHGAVARRLSPGLANAIEEVAPLAVPRSPVPAGPVRWGCPSALLFAVPSSTGC